MRILLLLLLNMVSVELFNLKLFVGINYARFVFFLSKDSEKEELRADLGSIVADIKKERENFNRKKYDFNYSISLNFCFIVSIILIEISRCRAKYQGKSHSPSIKTFKWNTTRGHHKQAAPPLNPLRSSKTCTMYR